MKRLSETAAIERLAQIRQAFSLEIREIFEHRAKPCSACETPGACCLDEHFVNVRISRLEAAAIRGVVSKFDGSTRSKIESRLKKLNPNAEFYACPLYQPDRGCLVHATAKPLPCIAHACYEREQDLPPAELLNERELEVDRLNRRTYGRSEPLMPIHAALR